LQNLVKKVDALVIGGGMANTFLAAKRHRCRQVAVRARSRRNRQDHHEAEASKAGCAIVLPIDGVVAREFKAGADNETVDVSAIPRMP
jgi:phosphoglycerate kinase